MAIERGKRKTRIGIVVSDKMEKTVVVQLDQLVAHPIYKKYIKRRVKIKAHDELNESKVGDKVLIVETRPMSRDKRWRVREIIEKYVSV
jgi:small subunit ribosomal protein S17